MVEKHTRFEPSVSYQRFLIEKIPGTHFLLSCAFKMMSLKSPDRLLHKFQGITIIAHGVKFNTQIQK